MNNQLFGSQNIQPICKGIPIQLHCIAAENINKFNSFNKRFYIIREKHKIIFKGKSQIHKPYALIPHVRVSLIVQINHNSNSQILELCDFSRIK